MDIYKEKFTSLQRSIIKFLFLEPENSINQRQLAKKIKVSPTAISKSLSKLIKENLILVKKDESKRLIIELNRNNDETFHLKRVENLRAIYESGLLPFLSENFPLATIILFGSYSLGEDVSKSDIDIAIIGYKEKKLNLKNLEGWIKRKISLQFYPDLKKIETNLKSNILNGITLKGGIEI